jgi:hypothetical protein
MSVSDYDLRSLQHERRMLDLYSRTASNDGGLLQPLANACWRASAFEWRLHEDVGTIRRLWEQAARSLAEGFVRKRAGFSRSQEQLVLALHFAVAARSLELAASLAHAASAMPSSSRAPRQARGALLLLEGYVLIIRAVVERKRDHALLAQRLLEEARSTSAEQSWVERFPAAGEATWRRTEYEVSCALLTLIGQLIAKRSTQGNKGGSDFHLENSIILEFVSHLDRALLNLEQFLEMEINHRPKLYVWLPGIALSVLADIAGLPMDWLDVRSEDHAEGYTRLPIKLITATE